MKKAFIAGIISLFACTTPRQKDTSGPIARESTISGNAKSVSTDSTKFHSGDTIHQHLRFAINNCQFEFDIRYILRKHNSELHSSWSKEILKFEQVKAPVKFTSGQLNTFSESFRMYYVIPTGNRELKEIIGENDITDFFKIKDYNLDGINDFGLSLEPYGPNDNELIFTWLGKGFHYWTGLSKRPIWNFNLPDRTITTGWHISADQYYTEDYKIIDDTTMTALSSKQVSELNDSLLIMETRQTGKPMRLDTLNRPR